MAVIRQPVVTEEPHTLQEAVEYLDNVLGWMYEGEIEQVATQRQIDAIWALAVKASNILEPEPETRS